jgi:hypothetical protein
MEELTGRQDFGCNCYSAGEEHYLECVMPRTYQHMLNYFRLVADNPDYENLPQEIQVIEGTEPTWGEPTTPDGVRESEADLEMERLQELRIGEENGQIVVEREDGTTVPAKIENDSDIDEEEED